MPASPPPKLSFRLAGLHSGVADRTTVAGAPLGVVALVASVVASGALKVWVAGATTVVVAPDPFGVADPVNVAVPPEQPTTATAVSSPAAPSVVLATTRPVLVRIENPLRRVWNP
jgi:hypothetical protein